MLWRSNRYRLGTRAGKYLAQWLVHGAADIAMNAFDPRRFGARIDEQYRIVKQRGLFLATRNPLPTPRPPRFSPFPFQLTPLYETLKNKGAVYEDIYGWERPYWYAADGVAQKHIESFRRTTLHNIVGNEVKGLRQHAGIADMSPFAKLEIIGDDAESYLSRTSSIIRPQISAILSSVILSEKTPLGRRSDNRQTG